MVFRFIGVILELIWAIAKREVEINSLKERATKAEKELRGHVEKNRELHERLRTLEIQREGDKASLVSLEKSLAMRREFDTERIQVLETRRDTQGDKIARLEVLIEPNRKLSAFDADDSTQRALSDVMEEAIDKLKQHGYSPSPINPTDN